MNYALKMVLLLLTLFALPLKAADLQIGADAPKITATNQDGKVVNFDEVYKKNKFVLVYFYPKADTPGCTAQANSLKDAYEELNGRRGVAVLGVSSDAPDIQKDFQKKYSLPFDLIADEKKEVMRAFGVSSFIRYASRQAFLIKEGKVAWLDRSASTKELAQDVLKFLESEK